MTHRTVKRTEHSEQVALVETCLASGYPYNLLHAIPNGGKRDAITGARLKAEGARAGIPDLMLPVMRGGFGGLYIELKIDGGRVQPAQAEWHAALRREGYAVAVCYGCDAAWQTVQDYVRGDYR